MTPAERATPEGQRVMFYESASRGTVLMLNRAVRSKGGSAWADTVIESAAPAELATILEDLRQEWNKILLTQCVQCARLQSERRISADSNKPNR